MIRPTPEQRRAAQLQDRSAGENLAARLSARLLAAGLLDELALSRARQAQQSSGERFDHVLTRLGLVRDDRLAAALAEELGLPLANERDFPDTPVLPELLEPAFLRTKRLLPMAASSTTLKVAVADPFDTAAIAALEFLVELEVERHLAPAGDIDQELQRLYGVDNAAIVKAEPSLSASAPADDDVRRLEDLASEAPIIRLVQDLLVRAVGAGASDIHIEPRVDSLRVRFRIDGVLHTVEKLAREIAPAVTSRIKILARLDIAERRMPQDGRIRSVVRGREIDIRVSTVPTLCGESSVLRVLDRGRVELDFAALGFEPSMHDCLEKLLRQPHGIILVTGPTGSGKTTTLYTALDSLDAEEAKILTVEDPIEYQLPDINQIQVQPRIGLSFAAALRSILRQDPDVIMIGEIRDLETAQIAIQASLTGHLVLSTVHTNSAAATITRLIDMGVESYLLASSLTGVLAQRLVRRLCKACAEPQHLAPMLIEKLLSEAGRGPTTEVCTTPALLRRVGCPACRQTGYDGRTSIGELLILNDEVRSIIHARGSDQAIERAAVAAGMTTLYQDGLSKALAGETTLEEVMRVTRLG